MDIFRLCWPTIPFLYSDVFCWFSVHLSDCLHLPSRFYWSIILAFPVGGCSRNTRIETELCIRHSHRTIRLPWRLCLNSNTFQSRNFWKPKKKGCELKRLRFWLFHFLGGAAAWSRSEDKTSQRPDSQPVHEGSGSQHILCQSESMLHLSLHLTKNKIDKVVQPQLLRQCHKFSTIYTTSIVDNVEICCFLPCSSCGFPRHIPPGRHMHEGNELDKSRRTESSPRRPERNSSPSKCQGDHKCSTMFVFFS